MTEKEEQSTENSGEKTDKETKTSKSEGVFENIRARFDNTSVQTIVFKGNPRRTDSPFTKVVASRKNPGRTSK